MSYQSIRTFDVRNASRIVCARLQSTKSGGDGFIRNSIIANEFRTSGRVDFISIEFCGVLFTSSCNWDISFIHVFRIQ